MKSLNKHIRRLFGDSIVIVVFFALWEIASDFGIFPAATIPAPTAVVKALIAEIASGELITQTLFSLSNIGMGFLLCLVIAIPAGMGIGMRFGRFERWLLPFIRICEKLNPFALFPVFIILFGIGRLEKVMIVLWVAQWPLLFASVEGVRNPDDAIMKSARTIGARGWKLISKVVLPLALPYIFAGVKTSAQLAFFMIVASEMVGASRGLGWLFISSQHAYNIALMYGIILYITVLAILINVLLSKIEKRFSRYKPDPIFI